VIYETFGTFDWFVSKCEEKGIRKIDQWVQVQGNDGGNAIAILFSWAYFLFEKVVLSNIFIFN